MGNEIVEIVDENDMAIGRATRKLAHQKNLLHRLGHVVVENPAGEILVLKRNKNMEVWPSWLSNVGGHVEAGESYEKAAARELMEEIGISGKLHFFGTVKVLDGKYSHIVGCFRARSNGPFRPDREEIEKMEFRSIEQIRKGIAAGEKYTPTFVAVFEKLYGKGYAQDEIVDLINEKDEIIGRAKRSEVKRKRMLYRCAGIYVKMNGKIVIEKRAARKELRPGSWSIVEETVKSGETFKQAAVRGVKEELGLDVKNLKFVGKKIIVDPRYPDTFLLCVFSCEGKGKIRLQESEVEKVKLMAIKQAERMLGKEEMVSPGLGQTFEMYKTAEQGVTVSAPGKLMLSGEWSVLEGCPCVVLAVNRKVYAKAKEASENSVVLKDFGIRAKSTINGTAVRFAKWDEKLVFTKHALETTLKYLHGKGIKVKNFSLETTSDISAVKHKGKKMKIGFGGSAAAVVAITGAVLKLHGIGVESKAEKEALFKLGIIAHYYAQGKIGSGFDVAASTFGGALAYRRFDSQWLEKELQHKDITQAVEQKWPHFEAHHVNIPLECELLVGFTGKSAPTTELVRKVREFREKKPGQYSLIIEGLKRTTHKIVVALEMDSHSQILKLIDENRGLLRSLSDASGAELEIPEHTVMIEAAQRHGAAAKFSGAGGGDCGIGICFDSKTARKVRAEWKKAGIALVDAEISQQGARVEE